MAITVSINTRYLKPPKSETFIFVRAAIVILAAIALMTKGKVNEAKLGKKFPLRPRTALNNANT